MGSTGCQNDKKKRLSSELIREEEEKKGLKAGIHQCAGLIPNNKVFRDKIILFFSTLRI